MTREKLAKIKLVVSDMDGTLLDHRHEIPRKTLHAISKFEKAGGVFAIGTGRSRHTAGLVFRHKEFYHAENEDSPDGCTDHHMSHAHEQHHQTVSVISDTMTQPIPNPIRIIETGQGADHHHHHSLREMHTTASLIKSFDFFNRPAIFLNGAQVFGSSGKLLCDTRMENASIVKVLSALKDHIPHRICPIHVIGDESFIFYECAFANYLFAKYTDPAPRYVREDNDISLIHEKNLFAPHMLSICVRDSADIHGWLLPLMKELGMHEETQLAHSLPNLLSLLPKSVNKGSGVTELAAMLGLSIEQVATIGDACNDLEMIEIAGLGVAVENAMPELKKAADLIVNKNDHDELPGVCQLLELIMEAKHEM